MTVGQPVDADPSSLRNRDLMIREVDMIAELEEVSLLLSQVWNRTADSRQITVSLLRALSMTGNYVAAAFIGRRMVGATVGFVSADGGSLHSHITGVAPEGRALHAGFKLKIAQREWSLHRGLPSITWTFDPVVRRNAYFNLVKLGARATSYLPDFYGPMHDGLNRGADSDRLLIEWDLRSRAAIDAAAGRPRTVSAAEHAPLITVDAASVQTVAWTSGPALVPVPADIERIRLETPDLAQSWRSSVREVLAGAMARGAEITGFDRDRGYLISGPSTTNLQSGNR